MEVLKITGSNFQKEVVESDKPVVIDFWASWCGPCKMMSPIVDELASEMPNIKVGKINVDEENELAAQFRVMSIPTLVLLEKGKEVKRVVGVQSKDNVKYAFGL